MIGVGRLSEFVNEVIDIHNEENEDKAMWEIWLHRVFDKSYAEFSESIKGNNTAAPTQEEKANIVAESINMLNGFRIAKEW